MEVMDRVVMGDDKLQDVSPRVVNLRRNTSFSGLTLSRNSSRWRSAGELRTIDRASLLQHDQITENRKIKMKQAGVRAVTLKLQLRTVLLVRSLRLHVCARFKRGFSNWQVSLL